MSSKSVFFKAIPVMLAFFAMLFSHLYLLCVVEKLMWQKS
jgi:hypothetical protein